MEPSFWRGKRVFMTGHTGFKGGWLCLWLERLGAHVHGFALEPPTTPSLFAEADVRGGLAGHTIGDVRDGDALRAAVADARPDIVFHMAAQPLVRLSYADPVETYAVNVMGTVHLLQAVRQAGGVTALVNVTTDKCYENREWAWGYREDEPLGGRDPYSSSKACSELVTSAYRASFHADGQPRIASGRAGNVIGGGDWAVDRLLPDVFRAVDAGTALTIRNPDATRPWQHVLEPLSGYLQLAQRLATDGEPFASAWNFGPLDGDARPVSWILRKMSTLLPDLEWRVESDERMHEAHFLKLDSSRARSLLDWHSRWRLDEALAHTVHWHRTWREHGDVRAACIDQIAAYEASPASV